MGSVYRVAHYDTNTASVEDELWEPVLYLPSEPSVNALIDALPLALTPEGEWVASCGLWSTLLNTPHRGCNGVRSGYCANEWAPAHPDLSAKQGAVTLPDGARLLVPREGAGAIKLRIDVSRVTRVARFANELTEEERTQLMQLLAAERAASVVSPTCATQLCAILALLDKARTSDDSDFALYLASAVNTTEVFDAPERSQRRCRQLFVDKKVRDVQAPPPARARVIERARSLSAPLRSR